MTSIPRRNIRNLTQELQTALSQKQKTFSGIFITYLKSITNSEAFAKKVESASLSISEIMMPKKWLFKRLIDLDSEHLSVINVFMRSKHW